jgi:hypothetical protein
MQELEKLIYWLQKTYQKRYKTKIYDDLHIQKLYLRKLIKELQNKYNKNELENMKFKLQVFNTWHCYYLTEWFFNCLTDY